MATNVHDRAAIRRSMELNRDLISSRENDVRGADINDDRVHAQRCIGGGFLPSQPHGPTLEAKS